MEETTLEKESGVGKLSFEDKLDEDYMAILSRIKESVKNLHSESDRQLAQVRQVTYTADLKRYRNRLTPRPQSNTFNKLNHFLQLWLEKLCEAHTDP